MTPMPADLWTLLSAVLRRLRLEGLIAATLLASLVVPGALLIAWLFAGAAGWAAPSRGPIAVVILALGAAAAAVWVALRRWFADLDERRVAAAAEQARSLPAGSVRGVLELRSVIPAGTSGALVRRAEAQLAAVFAGAGERDVAGELGHRSRRRRTRLLAGLGSAAGLVLLLGLSTPERSRAAWAPLMHPLSALTPPSLPPLEVEPGSVRVPRGESLRVRVGAPQRDRVTVHWRAEGDVPRRAAVQVVDGRAAHAIAPVDAALRYWVVAPDGAASDTFLVEPLDPLLLSGLSVDVVFPAYLDRPAERYEGDVPPLALPEGSMLRIRGRATRALGDAALVGAGLRVGLGIDGEAFTGRWVPTRSGSYAWTLSDAGGLAASSAPAPLDLTLIPDSVPLVDVAFPGRDTVLGPEMRQPLVLRLSDDHGLASARLVSRRVTSFGGSHEPMVHPLPLEGGPEAVMLRAILDATDRDLLPGDALEYHVEAVDNSPGGQVGRSRTYLLRLPSLAEMRSEARREASELAEGASTLSRAARDVERQTRELQRRLSAANAQGSQSSPPRPGGGRPGSERREGSLAFEQAEEARRVLEAQESVVSRLEELRAQTEALERASQAAGLNDPELRQRLQELRNLMDQVLSSELKDRLEALRRSLDQLDPKQVEQALQDLAREQERFRQQVEQALELLQRAAVEQQMSALSREARELAMQQEALADMLRQQADSGSAEDAPDPATPDSAAQPPASDSAADQTPPRPGLRLPLPFGRKSQSEGQGEGKRGEAQRQGAAAGDSAGARGERAAADSSAGPPQDARADSSRATAGADSAGGGAQQGQRPSGADQAGQRQAGERQAGQQQGDAQQGGQKEAGQKESGERQGGQKQGDPKEGGGEKRQDGQQGGQRPGMPSLPKPSASAGQQQELAERGASLTQAIQELQQQLSKLGEGQAAQQAGEAGSSAKEGTEAMQQAAEQAGSGQGQQASQSGQQGAAAMNQAAQALESGRAAMTQAWKEQVEGTLQQATQDALSLAQQEQSLLQQMQDADRQQGGASEQQVSGMRGEQAAVQQGLEALGRNLSEAAQRSALMSQDVGSALGRAMLSVQQSLEAMGGEDARPRMPVQETQSAVDALNRLALSLLQNSQQVAQSQSGTGLEEAMEQLARAADQQGELNGQSSGLMPMELSPDALARQLQSLARQQQHIANQLEGVRQIGGAEDQLLGRLDQLAQEAERLAEELGRGRLTPETVARQERLFHRLLDAGRTLEKDELSDERTAEGAAGLRAAEVEALDPSLLEAGPRFPVPDPEQLRGVSPAYRRLILDYFERLNRASRGGSP